MLPPSEQTKLALVSISGALNRLHQRFCDRLPRPRNYHPKTRRKTKDEIETASPQQVKTTAGYVKFNERIHGLRQKSQALSACAELTDVATAIGRYLRFIEDMRISLDGDEFAAADAVLTDVRQLQSLVRIAYSHPDDAAKRADAIPKKGAS